MICSSYNQPLALITCRSRRHALEMATLLAMAGIIVVRNEARAITIDPVTGTAAAGTAVATLLVPPAQLSRAHDLLRQHQAIG